MLENLSLWENNNSPIYRGYSSQPLRPRQAIALLPKQGIPYIVAVSKYGHTAQDAV